MTSSKEPAPTEWRAKLAEVLYPATGALGVIAVDRTLPVVRAIVAEELRDLADQRVWVTPHDHEVVSVMDLYDRADEIEGRP